MNIRSIRMKCMYFLSVIMISILICGCQNNDTKQNDHSAEAVLAQSDTVRNDESSIDRESTIDQNIAIDQESAGTSESLASSESLDRKSVV